MDTGASGTVINAKIFAQVADKDKVRLDTHSSQLGLTGTTKHPLEILGVFKIRMNIPELGAISPVVIVVVRNISWLLILGMDLVQTNTLLLARKMSLGSYGVIDELYILLRQTCLPTL